MIFLIQTYFSFIKNKIKLQQKKKIFILLQENLNKINKKILKIKND